jgi:3-oxoacyl-[acyl-carrier protein] reductase
VARTAIVTGGSAGIGFAIAEAMLRRGHRAFICGRDRTRLDTALAALDRIGPGRVAGTPCDVRDPEACLAMAEAARTAFNRVDVLVNNAGQAFVTPFDDVTPQMWRDIVDTNLTGVFNACKAVVPLLRQAGSGDIINMGSRSGRYSFRGGIGYNTTKFGLQGFTEALFLDLHQDGIRVSLVAPGTVATGLGGTEPKDWHLRPEDVGEVVVGMIEADPRACVNWVEIRPAPPK